MPVLEKDRKEQQKALKTEKLHYREQKRVSISSKRQFTIPQKFFTELGFGKEAMCSVEDGRLIITPVSSITGSEFAEEILTDLIAEGYSGQKLLFEFRKRNAAIRPALERMLKEAGAAARGETEYSTYEDIFQTEEDE